MIKITKKNISLIHKYSYGILLFILLITSGVSKASIQVVSKPSVKVKSPSGYVQLAIAQAGSRIVSVGERGLIFYTDDRQSWIQAEVPVSVTLTDIEFSSDTEAWAVGHGGIVLHSTDRGETWKKKLDGVKSALIEYEAAQLDNSEKRKREATWLVQDGADKPLLSVIPISVDEILVVGAYGMVFYISDKGEHWTSLMGAFSPSNGYHLYAGVKLDDALVFVGEQGLLLKAVGDISQPQVSRIEADTHGTFFGVTALNNVLVAYGLKGNLYRSTDQGDTWRRLQFPPITITSSSSYDGESIMLATEAGSLFMSDEHAHEFNELSKNTNNYISGFLFDTVDSAFFVGAKGITAINNIDNGGDE